MTFAVIGDIITLVSQTDRFRTDPDSVGEWCNGSTYDSDSYCLGSNPSSPAYMPPLSRGLGRGPLKAETGVRIPSEVLHAESSDSAFFVVSGSISPCQRRMHGSATRPQVVLSALARRTNQIRHVRISLQASPRQTAGNPSRGGGENVKMQVRQERKFS